MKIKFVFSHQYLKPQYFSGEETTKFLRISRLKVLRYHAKKYELVYAEDKDGNISCYKNLNGGWERVEVKKKINIK